MIRQTNPEEDEDTFLAPTGLYRLTVIVTERRDIERQEFRGDDRCLEEVKSTHAGV